MTNKLHKIIVNQIYNFNGFEIRMVYDANTDKEFMEGLIEYNVSTQASYDPIEGQAKDYILDEFMKTKDYHKAIVLYEDFVKRSKSK
jgi:hypothetical protein